MAKVSPQPSSDQESTQRFNSLDENKQDSQESKKGNAKEKRKLPRSVSQIVEQREENEKTIVTRFRSRIEEQGLPRGLMDALLHEVELTSNRAKRMILSLFRTLLCKKKVDEHDEENRDEGKEIQGNKKNNLRDDDIDSKKPAFN